MLKNYLKVALRNLAKYKGYSLINILGLAVGMACCILIMLWVADELSYDRFHQHGDRLYRVSKTNVSERGTSRNALTPFPLAAALVQEYPEIVHATRYDDYGERLVIYGDLRAKEEIALADPDFLRMFSFPLLAGDPETALNDPTSVIITQKLAAKYFGEDDPLGQTLAIEQDDYTVTGILADLPAHTHFKFDCLKPHSSLSPRLLRLLDNWDVSGAYTYVQLHPDADPAVVAEKIADLRSRKAPENGTSVTFALQPVSRIHLHHEIRDYIEGHGDIKYVTFFSLLAVLILLIACINFVNLTTARSLTRSREVGLRKVVGANRRSVVQQFLAESVLFALAALILALVLTEIALPTLNNWSGKQLDLNLISSLQNLLIVGAVLLVTGLAAGAYPALVFSSFSPLRVLKKQLTAGRSAGRLRGILIVAQFTITVFLIAGATAINHQLQFLKHKDLGFDQEQLLYISMRGGFAENWEALMGEFAAHPGVRSVTAGISPTGDLNPAKEICWDGGDAGEEAVWGILPIYYDYIETLGMKLAAGRSLSREYATDAQHGFLINRTAARIIGEENLVGREFSFKSFGHDVNFVPHEGTIIGVVEDFHYTSLHDEIGPVIMYYEPDQTYEMIFRVQSGLAQDVVAMLQAAWQQYSPEFLIDYHFADQTLRNFYQVERRLAAIFNFFTILAILLSCLGLLGLTSFLVERKVKEIGIRKVLGATSLSIVQLMSKQLVLLVLAANLIAWPVAWYALQRWLEGFAYRIDLGWEIFLIAGGLALFIALLTVSLQTLRAAATDPIKSLRYE